MPVSEKRLAVVTGACLEGIGTAVTRRLLDDGFDVIGTYEAEDAGLSEPLAGTPGLTLVEINHADHKSFEQLYDVLPGGVDISAVVYAQFLFAMEKPAEFDFTQWDRSLAVNLTGPIALFHALGPRLASGASFVTITSTEAFAGSYGASAYAASKAGVHNLTMTLANIAGRRGIRVNALAAGWIGGVMDTDEVFNMSRNITPLGRLGDAKEVASAASFLLGPDASFVNGSVLVVDGGYTGADPIAKFEFESEQ